MLKNFARLALLSLLLAWIFDQLFWGKLPGISFPIFVALALILGLLLAWREGVRPAWGSLLLLVPIGFFAVLSFLRLEPLTQFLNYALALGLMALLTVTFAGGRWMLYGIADYLVNLLLLLPSLVALPVISLDLSSKPHPEGENASPKVAWWKPLVGILRGVLLALPVLIFFTALLTAADAAFSAEVSNLLKLFDLDKIPEYIFRLFLIGVVAYLLAGIYLHALTRSRDEKLLNKDGTKLRFLPSLEALIVLGSVDALFAAFVAVQVRYFFGGQTNINVAGFTYSEYAVRGFNELLAVAFFSLMLFLGLSSITRRETPGQRWFFSALGTGLALLVTVILISAFQRLSLYEQAYGFTRLRLYTHVFMGWLGLLLLAVVALEWFGRLRHFALTAVLVVLGFAASFNLLNVDALIVQLNVAHGTALVAAQDPAYTRRGPSFDAIYLATLTDDAIPALVTAFHQPDLDPALHDELGATLACKAAVLANQPEQPWQSFHWSSYTAANLLRAEADTLSAYPVTADRGYQVQVNGQERPCFSYAWDYEER
jgi:hypothetical protein